MNASARPLTLVGMVWRNLYRQPLRTSLTVLGVAAGVIAIVALSALVQGIRDSIEAGIHVAGSDLMIFQAGVAADILSSLDEEEIGKQLQSDPDVAEIAAGMSHVLPVENNRFTVLLGVQPGKFNYEVAPDEGKLIENDDEASIGASAARQFKKGVGDTLQVGRQTFRIVSVFHSRVLIYDAAVLIKLPVLQKMLGREGRVTAFFVKLRPGANASETAKRLERDIPEIVAIGGAEEYHKVDHGLQIATGAIWAITLAATVIGAVVVLNTMWMTVLERTREIGVLRAVGWSRGNVIGAVLTESLAVGVMALAVGTGLGIGLAYLATMIPGVAQFLRPTFQVWQFLFAFAAAVVLSLLGGTLPAWRAARISPAEALRYE